MESKVGFKGIVEYQLFDKNGNAKRLFQGNKLWDILHKAFGVDVVIPGITGEYTFNMVRANTFTTKGKELAQKLLSGQTATAVTYQGLGIGTGGTTALNSEITTVGGERAASTITSITTTVTNDTANFTHTWAFTGTKAVTEEGLFNDASAGDMAAYQSFSAINVVSGDSLQVTHKLIAG